MIFRSAAEARSLGLPLVRLIVTAFARLPSEAELRPMVEGLRGGEDLGYFAAALVRTDEFVSRHGPDGRIDGTYVQSLFWAIDGWDPAAGEADRLLGQPHAGRASILGQVSQSARAQAAISLEQQLYRGALPPGDDAAYQLWLAGGGETALQFAGPLPALTISIVIEAPPGRPDLLEETLGSLRAQTTPHWEALILGPGTAPAQDNRVRFISGGDATRAEGLNKAAAAATGTAVGFITASDQLAPQAIEAAARQFASRPGLPMLYTDEDRIAGDGTRSAAQLKPAWNPDLPLYGDTLGQLALFDRRALLAAGGMAAEAGEYALLDLALRLTAKGGALHQPGILFHRGRADAGRTVAFPRARTGLGIAALDATVERFLRQHRPRIAIGTRLLDTRRWPQLTVERSATPRASIVVPALGAQTRLAAWLSGVLSLTDYPDLEVIVVQRGEMTPVADARVRCVAYAGPASWAEMANAGAAQARGDVLLLLEQDVVPESRTWLRRLTELAGRPDVGVVGPRLLRGDGTLLDAGLLLGPHGEITPVMAGADARDPGYRGHAAVGADVAALRGACFMVRRTIWDELGGLDAGPLPHAWAEVDFCLQVRAAGHRVLWDPVATLTHHGAADIAETPETAADRVTLQRRWPGETAGDPCFNPLLRARQGQLVLTLPEVPESELTQKVRLTDRLRAAEAEIERLRTAWPRAELQRLRLEREALTRERDRLAEANAKLAAEVAALPPEMIGVARSLQVVPQTGRGLVRLSRAISRTGQRRALLRQRRADQAVIEASPVFDRAWYAAHCMDDEPGARPVSHYLWRGAAAGLDPHPLFDRAWYAARTPELGLEDPWAHYVRVGMAADADPHPLFDVGYYLVQAPEASGRALLHYMSLGPGDTRSPSPLFDPAAYGANLAAYAHVGVPADVDPHPLFACRWYRSAHLGANAKMGCLAHWMREGAVSGLPTNPYGLDSMRRGQFAGPEDRPAVTAIVARGDSATDTARTLLSLSQQDAGALEAIVIGEGAVPADLGPIGIAKDRAAACLAATGEFVLFLAGGSVTHPELVDALLQTARSDGRIAMIGCRVLDGDGTVRSAGATVSEDGTVAMIADASGFARPVDAPDPAAMLVRREAWRRAGGLPDSYENDTYAAADIAFTVRQQGGRVMVQPAAIVTLPDVPAQGDETRDRVLLEKKWAATLGVSRQDRRHVLVLADTVPARDDPAGSALSQLLAEGARVTLSAAAGSSAAPAWEREGVEVMRTSADLETWLASHGLMLDEVWSFRAAAEVPVVQLRRATAARLLHWDGVAPRPAWADGTVDRGGPPAREAA